MKAQRGARNQFSKMYVSKACRELDTILSKTSERTYSLTLETNMYTMHHYSVRKCLYTVCGGRYEGGQQRLERTLQPNT